jgi:hypothetical protein
MRAPALFLISLLPALGCTPLKKGSEPDWEPGSAEQGGAAVGTPVSKASPRAPVPPPPPPPPAPPAASEGPPSPAPDAGGTDLAPETAPEPPATDGGAALGCRGTAPENLGQECGACGGRVTCSGACSRPTPPDHGEVKVDTIEVLERTDGRSSRSGERIGRDCPAGHVGAGCSVEMTRTGSDSLLAAGCYVTSEGRSCRCRVRWWADAQTTLRCTVTILTRRICDR